MEMQEKRPNHLEFHIPLAFKGRLKSGKCGDSSVELDLDLHRPQNTKRIFIFFSVKDRNLFHRVDTIDNIFTSGVATSENITDGVHAMK